MAESSDRLRLDKWLWAARFFKTRSLAAEAVEAGRVRLNGSHAKPAREVKPGDALAIRVGEQEWTIEVRGLSARRGPAIEARTLYVEREHSIAQRLAALAARREHPEPGSATKGRPTKRDRRLIRRFTEG